MDKKQQEQLRKGLVFGGLGLLCALSLWFIFAPSDKDKAAEQEGLNKDIPEATVRQLTDNKLKSYELSDKSASESETQAEIGRLSDYFAEEPASLEAQGQGQASSTKIEGSLQRYEENKRLLSSFYAPDPNAEERDALRAENEGLREALRKKESEEDDEEKQLRLMERSYQMASKYLPKGGELPAKAFLRAEERPIVEPDAESTPQEPRLEVLADPKHLVSSLAQPMADSTFMQEYGSKVRHLGFHSALAQASSIQRNTLPVVVDHTTILREGDYVALRLLESARIGELRIPRQSLLIAQAKLGGNRLQLLVKSMEIGGRIIPVKLSAYDLDGQEGIYIPGAEQVSALKEVGANIGGSVGTSFTFASSAKDQIISEAARGVMQGASQLLQKKLRTLQVTLKGGYRLFLVSSK
ncbi:conjugative transposon TraM protein [Porphyromonas sp. oral taxon 278 str. W7784]|uniref:conjugative transposon protein TraM n=1 Tax=Porphyromonas sp. oral taxon 278 TaxID=712437 RepID=UPI0003AD4E10|nr:conjugative transposon protein TraM [Porphyromonas sp. oral taxon 278]ERJ69799.1 conjugative transposon TraM protein [Porphyromonas sp. oral taxon 278 str. W7784]